jgi:uncharacterized protein YkwD
MLIFVENVKTKHMKNLITILFLVLNLVTFAQDSDTLSTREVKMIEEINALRVNPSAFIPNVQNYIKMCDKKLRMLNEGTLISTADIEGQIAAANELIEVLSSTKPLNELVPNNDMYLVTKAHGQYLKSINSSSHESVNGDLAPNRMDNANVENVTENIVNDNGMITPTILLLLVDAGISSRGHRTNLLDPNAKFISVYTNGTTWVQNFAN